MTNPHRLAQVSESLRKAADARALVSQDSWAAAWNSTEQELLKRLLDCEPEDDVVRFRLAEAIKVARKVRIIMESTAGGIDQLSKELDQLEGRKLPRVA